ncbi:MAG: zf-HC2 domain-containing protein [Bryobacteraceae bacterium]
MKTNEEPELLLDYCAERLSPEAAALLENHLESCRDCRAFSRAQQSTWDALDLWEPMPVPVDFDRKLYAQIDKYEESGWWTRFWHRSIWPTGGFGPIIPFAAAGVATIAVAAILYFAPLVPSTPQVKIESSDLEQIEMTLDDIEMFKQLAPASAKS